MSGPTTLHHHRATTRAAHKPFKPRFASKNSQRDRSKGRIDGFEKGARKTKHQHVMSKLDRRNQAKQKRIANHQDHARVNNVFAGRDGAARIAAIVPLSADLDTAQAIESLNESVDAQHSLEEGGSSIAHVDRFKQRVQYLPVSRNLWDALDACRSADYVIFILSSDEEVDDLGQLMLRSIESQGVSNVYATVQGIGKVEAGKQRKQTLESLKSFISHFFPSLEKIFSLDARQECQNLVRSLCTTTPKGIHWRDNRSWMLVENVKWLQSKSNSAITNDEQPGAVFTGVVRGKNLKADRLISLGDWGEFRIDKITSAPRPSPKKMKGDSMVEEHLQEEALDLPTEDQDGLEELAPDDVEMGDHDMSASIAPSERRGVLIDNEYSLPVDDDDDPDAAALPRRLPKGTSNYQSAWYLGDVSDSGSDMESVDGGGEEDMEMGEAGPADGAFPDAGREPTEFDATEYPASEAFADPSLEAEAPDLANFRATRKAEAEEDSRFPDEIELHPNVVARERLAKFRGLKSLRTSPWNTEEDQLFQPEHWNRLLDIKDYKSAKNKVANEALVGGVKPGTRVNVYVRGISEDVFANYNSSKPLTLFSLLRHEHKRTAVNFTLTVDPEHPQPIKSKDQMILQCGPRRLVIEPIFSQGGNPPNDVHKMERFAHPGQTVIASFTAPLIWGAVPALFFSMPSSDTTNGDSSGEMITDKSPSTSLLGTGTALPASSTRVIVKRIVLTGQPFKINKKVVTVRYMFFNPQDVAWFKALQLWTNHGRQGTIKESLGTHGYFKAVFDGRTGLQDAVGMSLYKRVWPRDAKRFVAGG